MDAALKNKYLELVDDLYYAPFTKVGGKGKHFRFRELMLAIADRIREKDTVTPLDMKHIITTLDKNKLPHPKFMTSNNNYDLAKSVYEMTTHGIIDGWTDKECIEVVRSMLDFNTKWS